MWELIGTFVQVFHKHGFNQLFKLCPFSFLFFVSSSVIPTIYYKTVFWGRRGRDRMVVGFKTTCATTGVVGSNSDQGEVCNIM